MINMDKKKILLAYFLMGIVFLISLIAVWYYKNSFFILIAVPPLIIVMLMESKIKNKYGLASTMKTNWEGRARQLFRRQPFRRSRDQCIFHKSSSQGFLNDYTTCNHALCANYFILYPRISSKQINS